ncbi:GGDEF domain-containing protein [Vibrio metschnikovii]|nr:GGDEF domain-containing protein [Vibrio metschnikovii]
MSSSQAKYLTQFLIVLCILGCVPFLYFAHELAKLDHHTAQLPNAESTIAVDASQFTVLNHHGDILDIDHFKRINDQFGHSHGDYVIQSVAETLRDGLRESDFLARIGGEEFAIILPHTPIEEAQTVIERLRIKVYQLHAQNVSISAGISDIMGSEQETYQRADKALYESKATGRNQVSILLSQEMAN